jgi:xylulokinase
MSADGDAVCGVDVGSQGACLSVFTADGNRLATVYRAYQVSYPQPGWAEQDPALWEAALAAGFRELASRLDLARIRALSFASQLDGLVCVDANGAPLHPAVIWLDRRADPLCGTVAEKISPEEWYERSGCNLDGSHVAAKIAWIARNRPEEDARAARYLLPGSYLVRLASGADAVDASNASSTMVLTPETAAWDERLLEAFEIDPARLPPVVAAHEPVGTVTREFAETSGLDPGTVVVCGCGDEMGATLGAGLVDPGFVCDVLGTAEPVCAVGDRAVREPSRVVECHPHAAPERWLLENPGWVSGGAYRWFRDELGGAADYEELNGLAAAAPAGSDGLVFLPWMGGATAPRWEASARGSWYGLTPAHGRAHLCRALLEGSAYALRDVIEAIEAAGLPCEQIVCVAGGARSRLIRQLRADVTGKPVGSSVDVETTARGAAMLAAAGIGLHASVPAAAAAMSPPGGEVQEPDAEAVETYEAGYARYRRLFELLAPGFAELAS